MPLPFILGGAAIAAGLGGAAAGIGGAAKMKDANDTMKAAQWKQEKAIKTYKQKSQGTIKNLDLLGELELDILASFKKFSNAMEKIQDRPEFKTYNTNGATIPSYNLKEIDDISVGAGLLLGGLGGAAAGTAGGFAAAGAATSAVMALGTASTGTAISTLSGAALTNATLAALGGGALGSSAYAGGMALGAQILGGATLGAGLLVGGIIFNVAGKKLSQKADEAYQQASETERSVEKIARYLDELMNITADFGECMQEIDETYRKHLNALEHIVNISEKTQWNQFTDKEKKITENTALFVGLLYKMCQVKLTIVEDGRELNTINRQEVKDSIVNAKKAAKQIGCVV